MVKYYIIIPQQLNNTHQDIENFANIMYIQEQILFATTFKKTKFITIQEITKRKLPILIKLFYNTLRLYNQARFQI